MNKKLINILMFTVGAAIGSVVTWKVIKTKYERIAQEEIDSVKGEFINMMQNMKQKLKADVTNEDATEECDEYYPDDDERDFTEKEKEQIEYYKLTSKYRGSKNDDETNKEGGTGDEDEVPFINGPYVITPDDFSNSPPGYNAQPLDYFADGVLADDWGVKINIEEIIGEDAINHFGEYVDDIVYIRNDRTEIDYEVTRDPRTYGEVYSC